MPLYWLIEWHVYKRLMLPWQQLISNLTRDNSADENAWTHVSWRRFDLTWRTLVKQKLNLLSSWRSVSWRPSWLNFGETCPKTYTPSWHDIQSQYINSVTYYRVRTDIQMLCSRTFQDLQRPNSGVFQDSKILFSRTFQETIHSKHWLHEVKKCIYKIGYQCICIKVKKRKCNTWGLTQEVWPTVLKSIAYACLATTQNRNEKIQRRCFRIPGLSMVFQDLCLFQDFPGLTISTI